MSDSPNQESRPPGLFKYLGPSRVDAIDGWLRCSPPTVLNDIFEMTVRFTSWETERGLRAAVQSKWPGILDEALYQRLEEAGISREAVTALPGAKAVLDALVQPFADPTKLVQSLMDPLLPKLNELITEHMGTAVGVVSFAEEPTNLLMWAHYAEKHTGYLVEFAGDHAWFDRRRTADDEFFRLRRVRYHAEREGLTATHSTGEDVFLTKSADWSYEKEWRVLLPLETCEVRGQDPSGVPIHLAQVPREAIRRVIVGYRMSPEDRRSVVEHAAGMAVYETLPRKDTYGLELRALPR